MIYQKILITGSRGIPARYGGFETFAEEISQILVKHNLDVTVQCDPGSFHDNYYNNVRLLFSKKSKSSGRITYYFRGIIWGLKNSDIILVLGSGGAVFYLLNFFYRKTIITNPDGLEYKRSKWPLPVRLYWMFSDFMAAKFSDYIVADSGSVADHFRNRYKIDPARISIIEYGAYINNNFNEKVLEKHGLGHKKFYLAVCRFEPENNLHIILEGFLKADPVYILVIVGNHSDNHYGRKLIKKFRSEKIIFTGGIYDKPELAALRFSCRTYIHGHSVGGTNPSLLEAMASSNPVICHDNIFNREVTAGTQLYFKNVEECSLRISEIEKMDENELSALGKAARRRIEDFYNWENIGSKYLKFLELVREEKKLFDGRQ